MQDRGAVHRDTTQGDQVEAGGLSARMSRTRKGPRGRDTTTGRDALSRARDSLAWSRAMGRRSSVLHTAPNAASRPNSLLSMPTTPDPLPVPSTDHDLTHIASPAWLAIWDHYVEAILEGSHAFHGAHPTNSTKAATYVAEMADAMMELRQERAQGHIDQGIVEHAKEREARKAAR